MIKVQLSPDGSTTYECDTMEEIRALLPFIQGGIPAGVRSKPEQTAGTSQDIDLDKRYRVVRFLADMTETSRKILLSLMEKPQEGRSLNELKSLLQKKDAKAVGGAIAGVGRKARSVGLPHVIEPDRDTGKYRVTGQFLDFYRAAGAPQIEAPANPK